MTTARPTEIHHKDGTVQKLMRHSPAGFSVPVTDPPRDPWVALTLPLRSRVTGGRSLNSDHPSFKHRVIHPQTAFTPSRDVQGPIPGQPRRRNRRAAARYVLKHHEVAAAIGGEQDGEIQESDCKCGAFFTAPTRELLREITDQHYRRAS